MAQYMNRCWSCGEAVEKAVSVCPHCGAEIAALSAEEQADAAALVRSLNPERFTAYCRGGDRELDEFGAGDEAGIHGCPACSSHRTEVSELQPLDEASHLGCCRDCRHLWCLHCGAPILDADAGLAHTCTGPN